MAKLSVESDSLPKVLGTYSPAVACDNLLFISGQIPLNPKTNKIESKEISHQINQTFENLALILDASGCNLDSCLKLTIFLIDLSNFDMINEKMRSLFTEPYPARAVVEVSSLPKGVLIEIDAIAHLG